MAADNPGSSPNQPGRPSWRSKAASAGSPRTAGRKQAGWAERKDTHYEQAAMRHRLRIAAWSLLFVGLVAGFIAWLAWKPLRTPVLLVVATDCEFPLPPNAWAREDAERLQTLDDPEEVLECVNTPWESKESGVAELRRQLAATQPGGPHKDLIVLYLSMPGAVDGQAEPCLIPPGASPWKSEQWLRVRDLLEQLFPKDAARPTADVKTLVILDATRMGANWNLGLPYNSFAERLRAVVQELSIPNLYVLNSSGPGQIGWSAPELKGSVFGYFLCQALNGAADLDPSGDRNKVIGLQELLRYLKAYVGQWVTENRADMQEPMLLPADADFPVVFRHSAKATVIPAPGEVDPRWRQIAALWEKHAELAAKAPYLLQPVAWADFQQKMLRLEQLVQAGAAYDSEFNDTRKQAESLAAALDHDPVGGNVATYSFPLLQQFGQWPTAAEMAAVPAPWKKPPPAAAKPPEKSDAAKPDAAKPAADKPPPPEKPGPYPYRAASAVAWGWLLADPAHLGDLAAALKFVDGAQQRPAHEPIEMHFLRMLAAHLDPPLWPADANRIQRAILARNRAEQAAAPSDARSLYWLQPAMATADGSRRDAEDRLFVGSPDALAKADKLCSSAIGENGRGGAYGAAIDRAGEIAAAFRLRDRAWAEIPYLAEWILARRENAQSADDQLRRAINATRALSAAIDAHLADATWPPEAAATAADLAAALQAIGATFQAECGELKTAGQDKQTLRRIAAVLAVPLVSGAERNRLRDEYLSIVREIAATGAQYEVALKEKPAAASDVAAQTLARLGTWDQQPMAMILDSAGLAEAGQPEASGEERSPGGGESLLKRLARQGEQLRRRLSGLPELAQADLGATVKLLEQKEWQPSHVVRAGDSRADRRSRAAAAFLDGRLRGKLGPDPADSLRRLDLHYLMLWQGSRTAADFWGPAAGQREPYFAPVARRYGESAEKLRKGVPRWEATIGQLSEVARQGVQPAVSPKNVFLDRNDPAVRHAFVVKEPAFLPKGTAAAYVRDSAGLLPLLSPSQTAVRRMGVPAAGPGEQSTPPYSIPNDARLEKADRLQAVALYRGHVRSDDFYVSPATGLDIVYKRPVDQKTTIVVRGKMQQTSAVMFILDCSGSMGARMTIEGKKTTRLAVARDTLTAVLRRLPGPQNPFDVGLLTYGHRVGWDPSDTSKMVIRDPRDPHAYRFVPRPPEMARITPSNDVELMLSPGRFGQEEFNEVSRKIAGVENMGETPLYLSIIEAIHALRSDASASQRRIVAITDGVNNQTGGGADTKYREDVEQEFKKPGNNDIRLDVVGFNIEQQEVGLSREETARRLDDLKALAKAHGGAFHDTSDPTTLLQALQRSLALSEYVVETLPGKRPVTPPRELDSACPIKSPPASGADYLVRLIDPDHSAEARATVDGGEALELYVARSGAHGECRLVYHRYAKELRDEVDKIPAPDDPQHRLFYIAAHLPEYKGSAARFFVSLQNSDAEQFSPRPQEAWIDVRPVGDVGPNGIKQYAFYDMDFLPERPVPVLTCLAPHWPATAKEAEIRLWCKLHKTPADAEVTVGDFGRVKPPVLQNSPGVAFEMSAVASQRAGDPFRVIVVERHPAGADLYSVKVEMQPPPEQAVHRYLASTGVIRHTFFYENADKSETDKYRVQFTSRQSLEKGAIALPRPLRVTVPVE